MTHAEGAIFAALKKVLSECPQSRLSLFALKYVLEFRACGVDVGLPLMMIGISLFIGAGQDVRAKRTFNPFYPNHMSGSALKYV